MKTALPLSLTLLVLAGCNHPAPTASASAANAASDTSATADSSTPITPAGPVTSDGATYPIPRAGLWVVTSVSSPARAGPAVPLRTCSDGVTAPQTTANAMPGCQPQVAHGPGRSIVFSTQCNMGTGMSVNSHGVISGDFQSTYRVHIESETQGAPIDHVNGHRTTDMTAVYSGACPAEMPPGSVEMGGRVYTREMLEGARAARSGG